MIPNDQSNIEIKYPEINPGTYSPLIYNKGGKTTQWKKDSHEMRGEQQISTARKL